VNLVIVILIGIIIDWRTVKNSELLIEEMTNCAIDCLLCSLICCCYCHHTRFQSTKAKVRLWDCVKLNLTPIEISMTQVSGGVKILPRNAAY